MLNRISLLLFSLFLIGCQKDAPQQSFSPDQIAIIPKPDQITPKPGTYQLQNPTKVWSTSLKPEWQGLVKYIIDQLRPSTGIPFQFLKPKSEEDPCILIKKLGPEASEIKPEGYRLNIDEVSITIEAHSPAGAFYGIQSLLQLFPADAFSSKKAPKSVNWSLPCMEIIDAPRFPYRGMHLDVSRHFFPVSFIKKYIDLLATHKLNRFHWHLTDDQGWRIEIEKYPKLNEISSYRKETLIGHYSDQPHQFDGQRYGGFYTKEEIKEVIQYARERFITIIPEIEMPGHSVAVLAAYPELACTDGPFETATKWGIFEDVYCPKEETFEFLENVLKEVMELFPSPYIHIGGDECPKSRWKNSAYCQKLIKEKNLKDEHELQNYFIQRISDFLNKNGRQIIGWDEILEGGLAKEATVMSWRGKEGAIKAAKSGHPAIMTPTSHCYFDYYQSDHPDEPLAIGGYLPLDKVYSFDPVPAELSPEEAEFILGAQGNVWTEYLKTPANVEYNALPRMCALAEVVWSEPENKNYQDFIQRLEKHYLRLEKLNVNAAVHIYDLQASIQPQNGKIEVSLSAPASQAPIYYTLDGTSPSPGKLLYQKPILLEKSTELKAKVIQGNKQGRLFEKNIQWHLATGKSIELSPMPHEKYSSGGKGALINGVLGSNERYGDAEWLGFWGDDVQIDIDLGASQKLQKAIFRFFNGEGQWIYLPKSISISGSQDGQQFERLSQSDSINSTEKIAELSLPLNDISVRYLKIEVQNFGIIPEGKQGADNDAWLFIDEIVIQ